MEQGLIRVVKYGILICGGFFILSLPVQAASLGEEVNFFVDSGYDAAGRSQVKATLRAIGNNIYFYIDNQYYEKLNGTYKNGIREKSEDLANEFDRVIYPKLRSVFGSEWNPGIDNDRRITVLITELVGSAGGYINIYDAYSKSEMPTSNQREMIYLNAINIFDKSNKAYLAHEFQHLITLYQKTILYGQEEEVWLNEARSEYAPTLCGYDDVYTSSYLSSRVNTFLENPSDSLTEWKNKVADYGAANLFLHYLVDHYGIAILTRMMLNDKIGIASINQALADLGYSETFSDIFADWAVANYLNDCQIGSGGKYCYLNKNLTYSRLSIDYSASYSGFPNLIVSRSSLIKDWSAYWYRFRQGTVQTTDRDTLKLEFQALGDRVDFRIPYIVFSPNSQTTVQFISLKNQKGTAYIPNFTSLNKSVVLIPFNQYKKQGFGSSEPSASFSFTASSVTAASIVEQEKEEEIIEPTINYPDGSLLRAQGDYRVYIIKTSGQRNYKRWIQTAEIFNHYDHLKWEDIIEVTAEELAQYQDSWLIRADGDPRVYELNADSTRHWLNMTAEQFTLTGHLWDMVYIVNKWERDYYQTGPDVKFNS
ncbi:MAG: hypothetical protein ABIF84_02450 [Patescibacteria group bacterium]